jgi:hypothetical protein
MNDPNLEDQVRKLTAKVAELETARAPARVEIGGFEGLRQLSHAIETKQVQSFMLDRSMPDRWFYTIVAGPLVAIALFFLYCFIKASV